MESWQDRLAALRGSLEPDSEQHEEISDAEPETSSSVQTQALTIFYERKGRGGKQATIITGFTIPDDALQELASQMKRTLGTGGSARAGEILIQGDRRDAVRSFLRQKGYKVK